MALRLSQLLAAHVLLVSALTAQPGSDSAIADSAADSSHFVSVAITRSASHDPGNSMRVHGRRFEASNVSPIDLITFAWNVTPKQVQGSPDWAREERFDLTAEAASNSQPTVEQWRAMVRDALRKRFSLEAHREHKLLDGFVVTIASQGVQMKTNSTDPGGLPSISLSRGELTAHNANMADLAETLQRSVLAAPVSDETGLTGKFDFSIEWDSGSIDSKGPRGEQAEALTSAMQKLGLRLEKKRAPADVFILDRFSRPNTE